MAKTLGVDVSTWNGSIDWAKFKQQGVKFAIIRAGFGSDVSQEDTQFRRNITEAYKQGIAVGIYWFGYCHSVSTAKLEADTCNTIISPYKSYITLPVFFDWEYDSYNYVTNNGLCTPTKKLVTDMTIAFMDKMQDYGYKAGYYTNIDYMTRFYDYDRIKSYNLWLAQWGVSEPDSSYDCVIHQYSENGQLQGNGSTYVDMNYLYSDEFADGTTDTPILETYYPRYDVEDSYWGNLRDENSKAYKYYYSDNVFSNSGWGLPNCTCYAWGRAYELLGTKPKLSIDGAHYWWGYNKDNGYYTYGNVPKLGAIVCWEGGDIGHVAVVEDIQDGGNTVIISESGYDTDVYCRKAILTKTGNSWQHEYAWTDHYNFQGFIYIGEFDSAGSFTQREWVTRDDYLTSEEQLNNAILVTRYFLDKGWEFNSIVAMLGNMVGESTISPGRKQVGGVAWGPSTGYGLCQWTPYSQIVCSDYCKDVLGESDAERLKILQDGDLQCGFIEWERQLSEKGEYTFHQGYDFKNEGTISEGSVYYWHKGDFEPPKEMLFHEFAINSKGYSLEELVRCFLRYYEHAGDVSETKVEERYGYAKDLYDKLYNNPEIYAVPPPNIYSCEQFNAKTLIVSGTSGGKVDLTKSIKLYYVWDNTEIDTSNEDSYDGALPLEVNKPFKSIIHKPRRARQVTFKIVQINGGRYPEQAFTLTMKLTPSYPCIYIRNSDGEFVPYVPFIRDKNGVNMYVPVIKLKEGYYAVYNTDIEKIS